MRTIKTIILISMFPIITVMAVSAFNENDANVFFESISTLTKVQSKLKTIKAGSEISGIIDLVTKQLSTAVSNSGASCVSELKSSLLKLDQAANKIASKSCANSKRKMCIQDNLADELLDDFQGAIDDLKEITVLDTDNNKIPDICDEDPDGDGIAGRSDNCPLINNPNQVDADENGIGDACELFYCCKDSSLTVPLEECERKTIDSCNKEGGIVLGGIPPIQKRDSKKRTQSLPPIPDVGPGVCVANCPGDTTPSCRNNCSGHGLCKKDGSCDCDPNWLGSDCSISCPTNCLEHGFCDGAGGCICDSGWSGNDCSVSTSSAPTPTPAPTMSNCPNDCSDHGFCTRKGECICDFGYSDSDCSTSLITSCPNDCSDNGECNFLAGTCTCESGWAGNDCSITKEDFIATLEDVVSMSTVPDMTYVATTYDCDDFASDLERELDGQGYDASFTLLWRDNGMTGHAVTDVHTTASEIIFIEPQNGMIIDLDEDGDGRVGFRDSMHSRSTMLTEGMSEIEVYMDLSGAIMAGARID